MTDPILETDRLTVTFGGHTAVDAVTFRLEAGSFKSIIGPNGAGKTTLFNLLGGQIRPTSGSVRFRGTDITDLPVHERTRLGIGRSFQLTNIFPDLTVLENVRLAVQAKENIGFRLFSHHRKFRDLEEKAYHILQRVQLDGRADLAAKHLSHGDKRKLEIAILLGLDPEVLLLDEPTAGMSMEEVPGIIELIRSLKESGKYAVLLIEHKIDMVLDLSDSVAVLFNGRLLADGSPESIMHDERVQAAYLGGLYEHSATG